MKPKHFLAGVLALLIFAALNYIAVPTLAFDFIELWAIILLPLAVFCVITWIGGDGADVSTTVSGVLIAVCLVGLMLYGIFGTTVMVNTQKYHDMLGKVEEGKFTADMEPISLNEIRIVDEESAQKIGDKLLGSDPALGSRVEHGEYTLQRVKNNLYWVSPLLHTGFWQWKNNAGTPGYVMVSATNPEDSKLVEKVEGKDILIKYQPEAYFGDNLERYIRHHGYSDVGLTDFSFEIDDELHPFWVVSTYEHSIGFSGAVATGVLVVDPQTGTIAKYTPENAPAWIDRIQPSDFVKTQINNWGDLVDGYWNWSDKGKLKVTDETLSLVYGADGHCYFYTGITSVGKDNGTIGFMLIDSRTKKVKLYKQPGAIESAAQNSAEGKVQQMGYKASYPIMYNIEGTPTYVMALKDKGGLMKAVAMVSVTDYSVVGTGADVQEALSDYRSNLVSQGNHLSPSSRVESYKVQSSVRRISSGTVGGNTEYYLILSKYPNKIFIGRVSLSKELPITQAGDPVEVSFLDSKNEDVNLSSFNNLLFTLQKTSAQISKDAYFNAVDSIQQVAKEVDVANGRWEQLSDKEKAALMKNVRGKQKN